MLCYITYAMLCYITYVMLYYMTYVQNMLYKMCDVVI